MNSTSIFDFLNPVITKAAQSTTAKAVKKAINYIDGMIEALVMANKLEQSGKAPTTGELETLNQFFGYGKAAKAFEANHPKHIELKDAFATTERYELAKRGVLHSYFTPDYIAIAMWRALCRLGVTEGRVLEPSCGGGQFIKLANPSFDGKFYGIELDPTVGAIARLTNPKAKIYTGQRFEHAKLPNAGQFDVAITNSPWGSIKAHDNRFGSKSIHNYFALRSLSELRTGGVMALVVSAWLMDSKNSDTRKQIARMADLVAAVRLPNNAFKSEGVSLPTDILIFQKKDSQNVNNDWIETTSHESGADINQWFVNNPHFVMGEISQASLLQFSSCNVSYKGEDLESAINEALDSQTQQPCYYRPTPSLNIAHNQVSVSPSSDVGINEVFAENGVIYQRASDELDMNGQRQPTYIELNFKNAAQEKRVLAYVDVKNAMKELLEAERANESTPTLASLRENLNLLHQGFVKAYGCLSRTANKSLLSQCSQYLRIKALEIDYVAPNKANGIKETFNKATILSKRVYKPFTPALVANSYNEALSICINELGSVCIKRIAELMQATEQEALDALTRDNMVFTDPNSRKLLDATSYLSGNVRQKLAQAKLQADPDFERNVQALEKVLPADLSAEEITVVLGADWVEEKYYQAFANQLMGENADFTITYQADRWHVAAGGYGYWSAARTLWGTQERDFTSLLQSAMNGTPIKITRKQGEETVVDHEASAEANAKLDEIVAEFDNWIWTCPKRRERLTRTYNDLYNSYVSPDYSQLSQSLTLDGCALTPFAHQSKAIMRGILSNNTLFDCAVGSGKTLIFQAVATLLKRMFGEAERIAITMPNALCAQFSNSMSATFPSANVITLEAALPPAKREAILNTAIVTDFDLLIIPESTFGALETPRDTEIELVQNEINELQAALSECEERRFSIKQIQSRIDKREAELEAIVNKPRLTSITWEDLNITTLCVDEIQIFKNLPYTTTYSNIRGMGTPKGSKKAWDFFVKARHIQENNGRVIGGTGSSLSNSITEAVTWMKVFDPALAEVGLHRVDSFIRQFSNPVTEYSLSATGRTLKSTTTLKRFQNLSELLSIYRSFAEVLSTEQLKDALPPLADGRPSIPLLRGGKIENVILPISEDQDIEFNDIVKRAANITRENNMFTIMDRARKASLDIRHLTSDALNPNCVANAICDSVVEIHNEVKHFNGTQIIFCDRSCPTRHKNSELKSFKAMVAKAESGDLAAQQELETYGDSHAVEQMLTASFSVYDEIESQLTERGLKVAVIHDHYSTDLKKSKLKADFNSGLYDVLLGSTAKLGTGWNLNERLVAAHHADLPLRPGDFQQRNGRIERQQSKAYLEGYFNEIIIKTYSTERTLDAWFASVLDRKARFISQFNNGTLDTREYELENDQIDFATLSALVAGDPKLLELVRSQQELKRLNLLHRSYKRKVYRLQDDVMYYQKRADTETNALAGYLADQEALKNIADHDFMYNGEILLHSDKALTQSLTYMRSHKYNYKKGDTVSLASAKGFEVVAIKSTYSEWEVYLKGAESYFVCLTSDVLNKTGYRVIRELMETLEKTRHAHSSALTAIASYKRNIDNCQHELTKPFKHEQEIIELKTTIADLEKQLANEQKQQEEEQQEQEKQAA